MNVVDAVVVSSFSHIECPGCGAPVMKSPKPIGTVVRVDLASRTTARKRTCSGEIDIEMVELADRRGAWLPTDLLMSGGARL